MYFDKKYLTIYNYDPTDEELIPKFYLDFFKLPPNLRFYYKSNSSFTIRFGFLSFNMVIEIKWGFVEREMNEREIETRKATIELMEYFNQEKVK